MHTDYDDLLFIKTSNQGVLSHMSPHYNQYEATPYPTLHALFQEYKLKETDSFVDFGCGKGRLIYYVHNLFHCSVTGIEMNEQLYEKTRLNKWNYLKLVNDNYSSIEVKCSLAEDYEVKAKDNKFYFFNPFTIEIFKKVISNIILSIKHHPREVDIILYYPYSEYIHYLETETSFDLLLEVKIPKLYDINKDERFLIFRHK